LLDFKPLLMSGALPQIESSLPVHTLPSLLDFKPLLSILVKNGHNNGEEEEGATMIVLGMEERREERAMAFVLWYIVVGFWLKPTVKVHITAGLWLEPTVIYHRRFTAGSSHKPAVMWIFIVGFWDPNYFLTSKRKIGSKES
jgi:hypothetical protein